MLIVLQNEIRSASQYFESIDTVNLQKYQLLKINFKSGFFQLKAGNYRNVYFSKRFLTFLCFVLIKKGSIFELVNLKISSKRVFNNVEMYRIKDSVMNKHTLNADEKFLLHMSTPSLIQVICNNIEPNLSSNGHNFIIETIPMTLKSKILDYQPKIKKYFRINTNELKSIQVELLDENDKLINSR